MNTRNCFVILQNREESQYNDFIGKFYHFPKKYIKQLSQKNIEFVYYEPKKKGEGVYFGYGKISKIFEDKKEPEHYFAEIVEYKSFSIEVPFLDDKGNRRETGPGFNIQNSVRAIDSQLLDELCLDGGILLSFNADAHLIKVLGEQLIESEKVGVLELIKNAYDAQASYCSVRIERVDSLPAIDEKEYKFPEYSGPVIVVEDDGTGMSKETIEKGWFRPASTIKTNIKDRLRAERESAIKNGKFDAYEALIETLKKEHKNRLPLGEKGVGRFATHRLGRKLLVKTKTKENDFEYLFSIDWQEFETSTSKYADLDSVGISLRRQPPSRDYGEKNSGTQIIIYGGKEDFDWNEKNIRELNDSILLLNSPKPNPKISKSDFTARLECPQISDLRTEDVLADIAPIFVFDGLVDESGILDYRLKFQPPKGIPLPEEVLENKNINLRQSDKEYWLPTGGEVYRKPVCGQFYLHIDIWYRSSPWVEEQEVDNLSQYLDIHGGVSIFRDGINVFPAQWGTGTDWLGLSTRHIKRGQKVSYYNMLGNVEIDQINNLDLIDLTNRQGLIKNQSYGDLKNLVSTIIKTIVEIPFIAKRQRYEELTEDVVREPKILKEYAKQGSELISSINKSYPVGDDPYNILKGLGAIDERQQKLINLESSLKNLRKSLDLIEESKELLIEKAGFGLAVGISVHEITKITANFYQGISYLLKTGKADKMKLQDLKDAAVSLQTELKRLSPLRAVRNEKPSGFKISKAIKYVMDVFANRLSKLDINVEAEYDNDITLFARYAVVAQIFSNLFDNSCYWLDGEPKANRKIRIKINSQYRTVVFADSGPGIHEAIYPYMFQAGYSMRVPPSGLGLYICRSYMHAMKGSIDVTNSREALSNMKGAQLTLDFGKVLAKEETD